MEEGAGFDLPYYITGRGGRGFTPRQEGLSGRVHRHPLVRSYHRP